MQYGLIGYPLKHSFSKEIHSLISNYNYEIHELKDDEFDIFMNKRDFQCINVTIPYKQKVIPYLDMIDEDAKNINAVNTIVNRNGKLIGYNTDILGVLATFLHFDINIKNTNVLILGTGATSNTIHYAIKKCKAKNIYKAYRKNSKIKGDVLYNNLEELYDNINIIVNTTSNGMYPHADDSLLIDLNKFNNIEYVLDVVYNPLKTKLLIESEKFKKKSVSGLYMLVAQAYFASQLFFNNNFGKDNNLIEQFLDLSNDKTKFIISECDKIYNKCLSNKINIVLTGMPTCGKTTLGKMISKRYGYEFIDTDSLIETKINCKISNFINEYGEEKFRDIESDVIKEVSTKNHLVISTGGGSILKDENITNLKSNGIVFFINRSLENLKPSSDRPLTSDIESLTKKFNERLPLYKSTCDYEINGDTDFDVRINDIINKL